MSAHYLISLSDSSALWPLHPGWGALEERQALRSSHRSMAGVLHSYAWSTHYRASLPLTFVESDLAGALAQWWRAQARLAWIQAGAGGPSTALVRIGNGMQPLVRRHAPEGGRFAGTLVLEGIGRDGDRVRGAPLILDHAEFGTLDTHNALL